MLPMMNAHGQMFAAENGNRHSKAILWRSHQMTARRAIVTLSRAALRATAAVSPAMETSRFSSSANIAAVPNSVMWFIEMV